MARVARWWVGLIPLGLLWLIAVGIKTPPAEQDLASRADRAVQSVTLNGAHVTVSGRDVSVTGIAYSEQERKLALAAAEQQAGVRVVRDNITLVPELRPFAWSATREDNKITLSGGVPDPRVRAKLLEGARKAANGVDPVDQMTYGRGAAARFAEMSQLGVAQLAKLTQGRVSITDSHVAISGLATDIAARDAIASDLRQLPPGFDPVENSVRAPAYVFEAVKDPVNATLTLHGYAPDNQARDSVLEGAKRRFFGERIIDDLKIASGAPKDFATATSIGLDQLARLNNGSLIMSDTDMKLSGAALYDRAAEQINTFMASGLPQGYRPEIHITVTPSAGEVDSAACQQLFKDLLAKGKILFETGQATIDKDSAGVLDHLVAIAKRCPSTTFEIDGYTDANGTDEFNMDLSQRRAQAVVDYLTTAGIEASRMSAVGFGRSKPIASNDTEEGKAQNRRIEIQVK